MQPFPALGTSLGFTRICSGVKILNPVFQLQLYKPSGCELRPTDKRQYSELCVRFDLISGLISEDLDLNQSSILIIDGVPPSTPAGTIFYLRPFRTSTPVASAKHLGKRRSSVWDISRGSHKMDRPWPIQCKPLGRQTEASPGRKPAPRSVPQEKRDVYLIRHRCNANSVWHWGGRNQRVVLLK